jgi:hypothetical protein
MANGYWVPGYWNLAGPRRIDPVVVYGRGFDRPFAPGRGYEHFRR